MNSTKTNPRVFLDVAVQNEKPKTMVFQLFADLVPKTVENFRALCTGEKGYSANGVRLCYKNTKILKIIPGFAVVCGDIEKNDGTGGMSIYGPTFEDEKFALKHVRAGLLSMVNNGPNSNQSQFYILLNPAPQLDGTHVVFGCIEEGLQVLRWLEKLETADQDRPLRPVTIVNCGELGKLKRSEPVSSNKESTEELKQAHGEKEEKRRRRRRRSSSSVSSSASEDGKRDDSSDERRRKRSSRRGTSRRERGGGGSSPSLSPTSRRNSFRRSSPHRRHKEKQPSPKSSVKRRGRGSFRYVSEAEMESGMDALPRFAASSSVNNTK
jgi:peptidyl-prolyl isomerase G (cyclophilin G)